MKRPRPLSQLSAHLQSQIFLCATPRNLLGRGRRHIKAYNCSSNANFTSSRESVLCPFFRKPLSCSPVYLIASGYNALIGGQQAQFKI